MLCSDQHISFICIWVWTMLKMPVLQAKLISSIWLLVHLCCFKFVFCPKASFSFVMSCYCCLFISSPLTLHACLFVLQLSVYIVWEKKMFLFFPRNNAHRYHFNKIFIAEHFTKITRTLRTSKCSCTPCDCRLVWHVQTKTNINRTKTMLHKSMHKSM